MEEKENNDDYELIMLVKSEKKDVEYYKNSRPTKIKYAILSALALASGVVIIMVAIFPPFLDFLGIPAIASLLTVAACLYYAPYLDLIFFAAPMMSMIGFSVFADSDRIVVDYLENTNALESLRNNIET